VLMELIKKKGKEPACREKTKVLFFFVLFVQNLFQRIQVVALSLEQKEDHCHILLAKFELLRHLLSIQLCLLAYQSYLLS